MEKKYGVLGVGNAMVDILIKCDDNFLTHHTIKKGVMQLVNLERSKALYNQFGTEREVSGGSGANTIYGLASLGNSTCYIGKVKDDFLGNRFKTDLHKMNIEYKTKFVNKNSLDETGRCVIFITPDGERSMNTYLGVTENLGASDIEIESIKQSEWVYLEGYRFDGLKSKKAFTKATAIAKKNLCKVALTLSDPFCVERHLQTFKTMISNDVDLLFCNEAELKLLYGTNNLQEATRLGSKDVQTLVCTVAERGAVISHHGDIMLVPTQKTKVLDTTGAGDLFAAGFMYGIIKRKPIKTCGKLGNLAASEIISHLGARPITNLRSLFERQIWE